MKTVSAAQANREFSRLMKLVENGEDILVTSRGVPKIKLVRVESADDADLRRQQAFDALVTRLKSQKAQNLPRATRDDMYE